jgi:hypothetical protein
MAQKPVILRGGLDLMTPAPLVQPGTLSDCLNYERGVQEGYSRMEGIQRHDGEYRSNEYFVARVTLYSGDNGVDPFTADGGLRIGGTAVGFGSETGRIVGSEAGDVSPTWYVYALMPAHATIASVTSSLELETVDSGVVLLTLGGGVWTVADVDSDDFSSAVLNEVLALLASDVQADVASVPGGEGTDIIGGFGLKNRAYVIRDLKRLDFEGGLYTDANEGQGVTVGGAEYEILYVQQFAGGLGSLYLHPTAGSFTDATGISAPSTLTITGTPPDCDVLTNYNESTSGLALGVTGGTAPYVFSIVDDVFAESTIIDADAPGLRHQQTYAALWKADADGWEYVDMGREMLFSGGGANLVNFNRDATLEGATVVTSGAKFPTAGTINGASDTGMNSDNATLTALSGASGDIFVASGFDFSGIPSTAIIRGITVIVERRSDTANQAKDNTVTLVNLTGGAQNKAKGGAWPNAIATTTYGGATDLWGNSAISVTDLQDADFGVMVIADRVVGATAAVGGIDYITVNVSYIERETAAYVWNATTDQAITIRHVQILGGDTAANTAYGYMTITCPQNADKTRIINVGDEIRTAASGGGNLLATVAARDVPIFLPGQDDLDNNNSAYEAEVTNFYASDNLDAAYIVCGVGPCVCFDGARTIRIRSDLPEQQDNPRHVARHGEKLALGYYEGVLVQSAATNPFELRASRGALYTPFGDRITGVRSIPADELLVPCESTLQFYKGYTATGGMRQKIAPNRGMLEYTDADVGIALGCDGLGIFDIRSAYNFGPAERNYLSAKVAPWLQPRLQATDNANQPNIRPLAALARRARNQYRLYFADGYVLTGTAVFGQAGPELEFTIQRYTDPSHGDTPLAIRALFSFIDQAGRERVFASFRGAKEGYLFELDAGRSFDGDAIPAHVTLNPITHGNPAKLQQFREFFVYGSGYGVANLTMCRAVNYGTPDTDITQAIVMGNGDNPAQSIARPFRGSIDFPIEGYDVVYRFDSSTASEGPHTLQMLTLLAEDRGLSRGHTGN